MTAYTAEQRKLIADVFVKVRNRMAKGKPWESDCRSYNSRYICDNIGDVRATNDAKHLAAEVIADRIGQRFCVENWLYENEHVSLEFVENARCNQQSIECKQAHAYRLRWLASLIAEFKGAQA